MEDLCTGCLSTGRKLAFIGDTGYYNLYSQIMNEIPIYDLSVVCVRVCWECRARLRNIHLFKQQAMRSLTDLMHQIPLQPTSNLSCILQHNLSYPEIKSEDEIVVKCESVEHCEPEPFTSALSVGHLAATQGNNVKPVKKKKKAKIKLKTSNRIKVKKKGKKQVNENTTDNINSIDNVEDIEDNNFEDNHIEETLIEESPIEENPIEESLIKESPIDKTHTEESLTEEIHIKKNIEDIDVKEKTKVPNGNKLAQQSTSVVKRKRNMETLPDRPQCQECGKVFSSKKTYRYHINVLHKGQNQYPCPRCGKVYQWKSNLGRHMRSHRAVDDGELYCSLCDKSFASVATFRQHLRISRRHVPEAEFSFACDECGKRFVNKTRLRDHVDWEHLNRIKFRCQLCNKPFKCHTSLYVHTQNVHVGKERKDNLCHVCGKSYQNAAKLKYHITAMHSGETPYRCVQCAAAFGWYSSLYRHMREVHYKMKAVGKKNKKLKQARDEPPQYEPL